MTTTPESSPLPETDHADAPGPEAATKPARKRRTVKTADEAAASGIDGEASVPVSDEAAPKPRRRRAVAVSEADVADAATADETAQASGTTPADAVTARAVVDAPAAQPVDSAGAAAAPATEAPAPAMTTGDASSEGPDGEPLDDAHPDSPRGRRRGRRERSRNAREGQGAAGGMPGDTPPPIAPAQLGALFEQVQSGEFDVIGTPDELAAETPAEDAVEPETDAGAPRRVLLPEADAPKLHKVLAQSGIGSRRDMEDLIADGHVMVNGETAHVGQRVSFGDQVKVNGKPVRLRIVPPVPRIIAYHKPVGEIVTTDDPQNRPTVFRRLPRLQQGKWQSVGRLDINTEGLLLFTNSGELANQLMHPRFGVEREYAVRLLGTLTPDNKTSLLAGVEIDGQTAAFRSIEEGGGDGANHWYRVVITEGRNREVRKLFDTVGLTVSRLIRIRYGTVVLPFGLKRGVWVDLEEGDVRTIRRLASGGGPRDGAPREARNDDGRGQPQAAGRNNRDAPRQNGQPGPQGQQPRNDRNARGGAGFNDRNARGEGGNNDRQRGRPRPEGQPPMDGQAASMGASTERDRDADFEMDFDPASIPNPLEQTFDKRFVQNPRSPVGGRGFRNGGGGGFGAGGSAPVPANPKRGQGSGGPKQPDPLQTSLGVFGADAFHRKNRGGGGGGGGGNRGGRGGGGFGGGGGGNGNGGGGGNYGGGGRKGR